MMISGYRRDLLVIAVPIMLNSLISQLQMLIDRIFLGRLDVIYMSAVGNATTPMWTTMSFLFALTVGSTILISQRMGAGKDDEAKEFTASMFKYNNIFALILFFFWVFFARTVYKLMGVPSTVLEPCVVYTLYFVPIFIITGMGASCSAMLQTCGNTKPLVIYGIIRSGLNILLDWLLIFGNCGFPKMGIAGAALATTIAEFTGGLVLVFIIIRDKKLPTKPSFTKILTAPFAPYKASIKMGLPSAIEEFGWNFGNLMMMRILNTVSEYAAGIFTIIFSIEILPVVVFSALGNATLTLTGKETGKRDFMQAKRLGKTAFLWCMGFAAANVAVALLFPKQLMSLFTSDKTIIAASVSYLCIVGINLFPKGGNIILGSGIRGYGDTRWMMFTQIFGTVFVIAVASLFVFVFKMGIIGVFCAVILDETTRCCINAFRFRRGADIRRLV